MSITMVLQTTGLGCVFSLEKVTSMAMAISLLFGVEVWETLREKIQSQVKPPESVMLKKPAIVFFGLIIFIVQLMMLSAL